MPLFPPGPSLRAFFALAAVGLSGCQSSPTAPSGAAQRASELRIMLSIAPEPLISQPERGCQGTGSVTHVWRHTVTIRNDEPAPLRVVRLTRLLDASAYGGGVQVDELDAPALAAAIGSDALAPGAEVSWAQCAESPGASDMVYVLVDAQGRTATSPRTTLHPGFVIDVFPRR